jgi:hypothetical protein
MLLKPSVPGNDFFPVAEPARTCEQFKHNQRRIKGGHLRVAKFIVKAAGEPGAGKFRQER